MSIFYNAEHYLDLTCAEAISRCELKERRMTQKQFYHSRSWVRCRDAYIHYRKALDGGLCEVCQQNLGKVVHHIIWLNDERCNDVDIALNFDNLRYECQDCHNKEKNPEADKSRGRVRYLFNGDIEER